MTLHRKDLSELTVPDYPIVTSDTCHNISALSSHNIQAVNADVSQTGEYAEINTLRHIYMNVQTKDMPSGHGSSHNIQALHADVSQTGEYAEINTLHHIYMNVQTKDMPSGSGTCVPFDFPASSFQAAVLLQSAARW
jgi:hypothetical protein